jgi:hypothetical protein
MEHQLNTISTIDELYSPATNFRITVTSRRARRTGRMCSSKSASILSSHIDGPCRQISVGMQGAIFVVVGAVHLTDTECMPTDFFVVIQ